MKKSLRHNYYAAGGHFDYADRLGIPHQSESRERKQHYMTKKARLAVKNGVIDGINLKDLLNEPQKKCALPTYYSQCEQRVTNAFRDNNVTKELCQQFMLLSDCMYARTGKANILARAAVRHRLAHMCFEEDNESLALQLLEDLIEELVKTTQRFGHDPDWDEYLTKVSEELCEIYQAREDAERTKIFSDVIKWVKTAASKQEE